MNPEEEEAFSREEWEAQWMEDHPLHEVPDDQSSEADNDVEMETQALTEEAT